MSKHPLPLFAAVAVVALIAGCQQEPATETGTTTEVAATEEASAADPAAARQSIEDGTAGWETAALASDAAALAALYAEDAVLLAPGAPMMSGRAEIEAGFAEMLQAAPFTAIDIVTEAVDVSASGDLAYGYGTWTSTNTVGGQPFEDRGNWTSVHENRDGRWVMVLDTWNSSVPMAGAEDSSNP